MPVPLQGISLRQMLYGSYTFFKSRFDNIERDWVKVIRLQKVSVYDGRAIGKARTKWVIRSQSNPQYWPYFQRLDTRGRPHTVQRTVYHQYDVTVQLEKPHLDAPAKVRTGSDARWLFGKSTKAQFRPRPIGSSPNRQRVMLREDQNVLRGRNGDFFFRAEWVLWNVGSLYGRNWTNGPPVKTNPRQIPFLDKHLLSTVKWLVTRGIIAK